MNQANNFGPKVLDPSVRVDNLLKGMEATKLMVRIICPPVN